MPLLNQFDIKFFLSLIFSVSIFALLLALFLVRQVLSHPVGNEKMLRVSQAILAGAKAYLKRQFISVIPFIASLAAFLYFVSPHPQMALPRTIAFIAGAIASAFIGYVGMNISAHSNSRVAEAARKGFSPALTLSFRAGAITGMLTVGLGLLGATVIYYFYGSQAPHVLIGFGFGGSLMALFMRVGGGIYTKAADIGADLVGKLEKRIPEDDPRNAAVIADLVGDNVGDCAGMASDLFESYIVTLLAAIILGQATFGIAGVLYPLSVMALGVITSFIGIFAIKPKNRSSLKRGMGSILSSFLLTALLSVAGFFLLSKFFVNDFRLALTSTLGILLSLTIFILTDQATGDHGQVKEIAKQSQTGAANTILSGLVSGISSTVWAILAISLTIIASASLFPNALTTAYGIALAGMGMLTVTGLIVSMDSYGPIADNAGGIAEMAGMRGKANKVLAKLDSIGNTTKAATKGFAISSAVIAALALFESYLADAQISGINIAHPLIFVGFLVGGAVPFLFSSLAIDAVSDSSFSVIKEVRRQFKKYPGILKGTRLPNYARVVDITTKEALNALIAPALLAIVTPILVGFLLKTEALGAFLAGAILTGQLLAVLMSNSGGAWDNAKKMIERGLYGGKKSLSYDAAVIGDTVGDPLKDTAGPSLSILLKVLNMGALLVVPLVLSTETLTPIHLAVLVFLALLLVFFVWKNQKN